MRVKHVPMSIQSKEAKKAEEELKEFQEYLKMLINEYSKMEEKNKTIINPFENIFIEYSEGADKDIREFDQQVELFDAYCLLTNHKCKTIKGYKIASQDQIKEYFNNIALENTLIPYENNFLKMIRAKDKKYELITLDEDDPEHIIPYINSAMEAKGQITLDNISIDDLNDIERKQVINKLMQLYRLNGYSNEHEQNVFFTVKDIKAVYKIYKDYKNIDDVPTLLNRLYESGYIGKLEDKYKEMNIYCLTKKTENINSEIEITKDQIIQSTNFLDEIGIFNN